MREKYILIAIFFCTILLVSGCFELEERLVLKKDGTGFLELEYWALKDIEMNDTNYRFPEKDAEIRSEIENKYTSEKVKLSHFRVREKKKSRVVKFKVEFQNILDLNDIPQFQENNIEFTQKGDSILFKRIFILNSDPEAPKQKSDNYFENLVLNLVEEGLSRIKFRFELETPYNIIDSNADWTPGKKRAIWRYNLSEVMSQKTFEMYLHTGK